MAERREFYFSNYKLLITEMISSLEFRKLSEILDAFIKRYLI